MLSIDKAPTESAIVAKRKALRVLLYGLPTGFVTMVCTCVAAMQWLYQRLGEANGYFQTCVGFLIILAPIALILMLDRSDKVSQRLSQLSWLTADITTDPAWPLGWNCREANQLFEACPLEEVQQYRRKVLDMGRPLTLMEMDFLLDYVIQSQRSNEKQEALQMQDECQKLYATP